MVIKNLNENGIKVNEFVAPIIKIYSKIKDISTALYLKDNDIGKEGKYQEKIFDMFERLHEKNEYQGTVFDLAHYKKNHEPFRSFHEC